MTKGELKGLKSLRKRISEGEIVVVPTDKTSNFSVMTRATYEEAGLKHTVNDAEVGWGELEESQKEINGHMSMVIKIFSMGENWGHMDRLRETMLGGGHTVCPVTLLFKDHKGWRKDMGTVPPTRHVAGGHVGMNLYLSEVVSDMMEPLVGNIEGGKEVISTEDMIANVMESNDGMEDWDEGHAWDEVWEEEYVACGRCIGSSAYEWDESHPELCKCEHEDSKYGVNKKYRVRSGVISKFKGTQSDMSEKLSTCKERCDETSMDVHQDEGSTSEEMVIKGTQPSMDDEEKYESMVGDMEMLKVGKNLMEEYGRVVEELECMNIKGTQPGIEETRSMEDEYENVKENNIEEYGQIVKGFESMNIKGTQSKIKETCSMEEGYGNMVKKLEMLDIKGTQSRGAENKGKTQVSVNFLKGLRRKNWEEYVGWDNKDFDRILDSKEALPEQIQNYEEKMVLIGSDVVSLYPNLEVDKVTNTIKEAILGSEMVWQDIDYLEGVRYLALNWSQEECNRSVLRRVLPVRRGRRGNRPCIKGPGPKGRTRGDQEQWSFPEVKLEEWEKKTIVAEVIGVVTKAMFNHHYYTFGGKTYHQTRGGPIGLRGTCAVARVAMQVFDAKWGMKLNNLGVRTWLTVRYVDDMRVALPPIKSGWRWYEGGLKFNLRWEIEDKNISPEMRTKSILAKTMEGVEEYLEFTMESGEDFEGGWLPTLDTSLKVGEDNRVMVRFYERNHSAEDCSKEDSYGA